MSFLLDNYMEEHFDILTIYDFYDDLSIKINDLLNYCIKTSDDQRLIEDVSEIKRMYKTLIMDKLDNNDY